MARYLCQQDKQVTIAKANKVCLIRRCPDLAVIKTIMKRGRLKRIVVPVVSASMVDINGRC